MLKLIHNRATDLMALHRLLDFSSHWCQANEWWRMVCVVYSLTWTNIFPPLLYSFLLCNLELVSIELMATNSNLFISSSQPQFVTEFGNFDSPWCLLQLVNSTHLLQQNIIWNQSLREWQGFAFHNMMWSPIFTRDSHKSLPKPPWAWNQAAPQAIDTLCWYVQTSNCEDVPMGVWNNCTVATSKNFQIGSFQYLMWWSG